ncbi:MAG: UDP-N-acetylmuramate--L-alanine ligase [SAR324 cluster bacterium]|uniref:UDP-N-acetylmuramate--L-alanine ligase n=1 Tax=SAR324 cluster bacterium TaxID=2024889 RepID=A0A7X9FPM4_9DELT|nr:UDP-N-acetylmuramate--L-alanine ligase [SAR324 cluster bacterium]
MYNPKLHFHFTGIGGVGMSGIAEVLINLGFTVSGSDLKPIESCSRLISLGARVFQGHRVENLPKEASLLVYSSAVSSDNPELIEAKRRGIAVIPRAEVLAELMRLKYGVAVAGSHGKTTTTSLVAAVMEAGNLDPTVIIGGVVKAMGTGSRLGKGDFLVAESDESDRSFLLLKPTVAVVTNIDEEHLSAYNSLKDLEDSFAKFVEAVPFYGLSIFCIDDPRVRNLSMDYTKRKETYGFSPDAQVRAENLEFVDGATHFDIYHQSKKLFRLRLPMPGRHFAQNALAAVAVGLEFCVSESAIKEALESFSGVGRRLELLPVVNGITIINDYGHHPSEVKASIAAVRAGWGKTMGRLHVVFQPHRYSRTRDCFASFLDAFSSADTLIISDIYPASEAPIEGVTSEKLEAAIVHPSKTYVGSLDNVIPKLLPSLNDGDFVLFLGAGSIGTLPEKLYQTLCKNPR